MDKGINSDNLTPSWPDLDTDSIKILQRKTMNKAKIAAFSIYMVVGLGFAGWGFRTLLEVSSSSPETNVAFSVVAFGLAIVGFGFAFSGFARDKEIENVTAGIYLLLRNSIIGQDAVSPSENSGNVLPEHGPWCACYCTVANLNSGSE